LVKGTVKNYSALKGDKGEYKTLNENDKVEFDIVQGQKGSQASKVVIIKKAPRQYKPYNKGGKRRFRF